MITTKWPLGTIPTFKDFFPQAATALPDLLFIYDKRKHTTCIQSPNLNLHISTRSLPHSHTHIHTKFAVVLFPIVVRRHVKIRRLHSPSVFSFVSSCFVVVTSWCLAAAVVRHIAQSVSSIILFFKTKCIPQPIIINNYYLISMLWVRVSDGIEKRLVFLYICLCRCALAPSTLLDIAAKDNICRQSPRKTKPATEYLHLYTGSFKLAVYFFLHIFNLD